MIEGYCVKCKAKRPIADAIEEQMKNGRKAVKGKCPTCGAVMFKILGGKALATPTPPPPPSPDPAAHPVPPHSQEVPTAPAPAAAPATTTDPTGPTGPSNA